MTRLQEAEINKFLKGTFENFLSTQPKAADILCEADPSDIALVNSMFELVQYFAKMEEDNPVEDTLDRPLPKGLVHHLVKTKLVELLKRVADNEDYVDNNILRIHNIKPSAFMREPGPHKEVLNQKLNFINDYFNNTGKFNTSFIPKGEWKNGSFVPRDSKDFVNGRFKAVAESVLFERIYNKFNG